MEEFVDYQKSPNKDGVSEPQTVTEKSFVRTRVIGKRTEPEYERRVEFYRGQCTMGPR